MHRVVIVLVLGLCCYFSNVLIAQSTNASVTGYVTDPSKAVLVDAKVIAINVGTNIRYESTTNKVGSYTFVNLPPGGYRVEVEKAGFKTVVKSDIVLHVQDAIAINFEMAVGSTSEVVTVTGGTPLVNTQDASVSTVVDRNFAENLPMNGRSFQTLIQLTPGVVLTPSSEFDAGQFSVNGQRASANYWMIDGVSANIGIGQNPGNGAGGAIASFTAQGGTNSLVSVDALQEFRIQTSTYAPEFGRTPGGQISIVTRSGTNQFHGTAFDYLRNDIFDANDWFADNKRLPKAKDRQNDFGGTFSGPILKDRTFFFFSYEGLRLRLPQTTLTTVPCDSTCTGFGNARAMAVPAIQPFFNAFPLPDGPEVFDTMGNPTGAAQFNASFSNSSTLNATSLRIDHRLSSKVTLLGRYNYSPSDLAERGSSVPLSVVNPIRVITQTATAGATWAVSPTRADEIRFNYSRTSTSSKNYLDAFGGAAPLTSLPFPSPYSAGNATLLFDIFPLTNGGLFVGKIAHNLQRQINIVDNLSIQAGSHSIKVGVDFRRLSPVYDPHLYSEQTIFFDVPSAEMGNSPLGIILSGRGTTLLFRNLGVFAQDTWRTTPRLTLTYGVRWDIDFAPSSVDGPALPALTGFNLNDLSSLALAAPGTQPFKTTYGNLAPRIGVAYQIWQNPGWETVLRGGFGIFYDLATSEIGGSVLGGYPFGGLKFVSGTFPFDPGTAAPPPITPASLTSPGATLYAFDPNLKLPYTLEWNFALEQALGRQQTISASYLGSKGKRLLQSAFIFAPSPNFAQADLVSNTATSNYNALQIQFQRRFSHGLQALASYTWSHSLDDGSAGSYGNGFNQLVPSNQSANRGPSDFDVRAAFSAAVTYDVAVPKINAFTDAILRGWSLQNVIQGRSATPVSIVDLNFFSLLNTAANVRPDVVPGQSLYLYGSQFPGGKAFNPTAFADPPTDANGNPLRQGDLGRNALRGFGAAQWDFAVHRVFPIRESLQFQFRAEMFNVLNHPNFGPPCAQFGFGTCPFGVSTQTLGQSLVGVGGAGGGAFSPLYQIGGPRSIQLALKFVF